MSGASSNPVGDYPANLAVADFSRIAAAARKVTDVTGMRVAKETTDPGGRLPRPHTAFRPARAGPNCLLFRRFCLL